CHPGHGGAIAPSCQPKGSGTGSRGTDDGGPRRSLIVTFVRAGT
ncbi:MAG: hypothetical protein AVDCRST_MAG59-663, partial [uncultured Thermomicrobiales bacterium]